MTLKVIYRRSCDFPGCDQVHDKDGHLLVSTLGWRALAAKNRPAFHLCPHHAETGTTAEDLEKVIAR